MFPTPYCPGCSTVRSAREAAGLTLAKAAALVYLSCPQRWAEYERGERPIDAARWELFLVKTGQHAHYRPARGVPVPKARKVAA